jgi:hypothetical protein
MAAEDFKEFVLQTASGEQVPVEGETAVDIALGRVRFSCTVFVAPIADEFILGLDIMRMNNFVIDVNRKTISVGKETICLEPATNKDSFPVLQTKLIARYKTVIPPMTEMIVPTSPAGPIGGNLNVTEPDAEVLNSGLLIGRTLISDVALIPVRVANVSGKSKVIREGQPLARCESVEWVAEEDDDVTDSTSESKEAEACVDQILQDVKKHMTRAEFRSARKLLKTYSDLFARDDEQVGRTNLTYHRIDTGAAMPI